MKNKNKSWELSFGFYPGIVLGFRSYEEKKKTNSCRKIWFKKNVDTGFKKWITITLIQQY